MKVEILRERTVRMAEHEILLAFDNDEDAELFEDWWAQEGQTEFEIWYSRQLLPRGWEKEEGAQENETTLLQLRTPGRVR